MSVTLAVAAYPGKYSTDTTLRARQRLWAYQDLPSTCSAGWSDLPERAKASGWSMSDVETVPP